MSLLQIKKQLEKLLILVTREIEKEVKPIKPQLADLDLLPTPHPNSAWDFEKIRFLFENHIGEDDLTHYFVGVGCPFGVLRNKIYKYAPKKEVLNILIAYAEDKLQITTLLEIAQKVSPNPYKKYEPYTLENGYDNQRTY